MVILRIEDQDNFGYVDIPHDTRATAIAHAQDHAGPGQPIVWHEERIARGSRCAGQATTGHFWYVVTDTEQGERS